MILNKYNRNRFYNNLCAKISFYDIFAGANTKKFFFLVGIVWKNIFIWIAVKYELIDYYYYILIYFILFYKIESIRLVTLENFTGDNYLKCGGYSRLRIDLCSSNCIIFTAVSLIIYFFIIFYLNESTYFIFLLSVYIDLTTYIISHSFYFFMNPKNLPYNVWFKN